MNAHWLVPDWPAPSRVRAVCTTRAGGQSLAPYASLNLGDHVGDEPAAVAANRDVLRGALGARPVFLQQVHGTGVVQLGQETPDGTQADGCVTAQAAVACTIMVADCLPVLFTDVAGSFVAAAHAGWRGLAGAAGQGILEQIVKCFRAPEPVDTAQYAMESIANGSASHPSSLLAWLGPCIGPQAFEVGPEVKAAFEAQDPGAAGFFVPHGAGKWLADLPALARRRLAALGITQVYGNDGSDAWCTVSNPSRFFSHRRDRVSGRMAACIWIG